MLLRCSSCSATLKVRDDRLEGRASAPCPKCGKQVQLKPDAARGREGTITVSCLSCKATLRAPASRAGSKSRCPKCRAEVQIREEPLAAAPAAAMQTEDTSGASTRRIDSRSLGLGMMTQAGRTPPASGIDVDEFVRSGAAGMDAPDEPRTPQDDPGLATSILKPRIEPMREAAEGIRDAAGAMSGPAPSSGSTNAATPVAEPAPEPRRPAPRGASPASKPAAGARAPFPSSRGLISGTLAGLLVGGGMSFAIEPARAAGFSWLIAAMPSIPVAALDAVPAAAVRACLVTLLGALAGFLAAAIGSPSRAQRPLSLTRCGSIGMLAGATAGIVITLTAEVGVDGLTAWPTVNWMRDLLLVGLLTPAFNRLLPGARS